MLTHKHIGGSVYALRSRLGLVSLEAASNLSDAHLFTFGEWQGHANGAFEFTPEVAAKLIANFEAQANPVPFTYEHDSAPGQPRPASGWVQSLDVRDDGLWAKVEWTSRAAEMIRGGEYRYCSVVVDFDSTCRKTGDAIGPELLEVGLTNTPFIDGQTPLAASQAAARKAHKMADEVTKEEVKGEVEMSDGEEATAASMLLTKLKDATGMEESALIAAVESKLDELKSVLLDAPANGMESDAAVASKMSALAKENEELRGSLVTAEVTRAIELGHVPAGQKDMLIKLGRADIKAARELIAGGAKTAKAPPTGTLYKASRGVDTDARDEHEQAFLDGLPKRLDAEKRAVFLSRFRQQRGASV